jgi:hypothetical protein
MLWNVTSSFRNHLWNVKEKNNEKITRREISFATYKTFFIPFFSFLWTHRTFKLHNFFIFYSFQNCLKCCRNTTWSSTNHLWTLILTKQHTRIFLHVHELAFVAFGGFFFRVFDLLLWGTIKRCGPNLSQPHFEESVRMRLTLPEWGLGSLVRWDFQNFRVWLQGSKHLALWLFLYHWKFIET